MELQQIENYKRRFDQIVHCIKAIEACKKPDISDEYHFRELTKMVCIGTDTNKKKIEAKSYHANNS